MLTISSSDLRAFQTCRRKFLLERLYRVIRWRPKSLFTSCLRAGVLALSDGTPAPSVVANQRSRFLSEAANPGLGLGPGVDSWTVAQDWAGMIATTLTAISRLTLLTLQRPQPLTLSDTTWSPSSWLDDSGTLHRWIVASEWNDDALSRELHSWSTIADMVLYDAPMTLHVVVIGSTRNGRRQSPWARCYKHPVIAGQFRFQRPDGKGGYRALSGDHWTPVWYADQTRPDPETWVDLMDADGVTPGLLHHLAIAQPSAQGSTRCKAEILRLAEEIGTTLRSAGLSPMDEPMARAACDPVGGPCPWQVACYRDHPGDGIEDLGLYQIRAARASGSSLPEPIVAVGDVAASVGT